MQPYDNRIDYERRIHRVLEHIDRHLDQRLDLVTLAGIARFSHFHFHRLFAAWTGETMGNYVRRRRVDVAALRLLRRPSLATMSARTMRSWVRGLLLAGAVLHAAAALAAEPRGPHPVGLASVQYVDPDRRNWDGTGPRPLATAVWYPAQGGTREADWTIEIFNAGRNAMGAPMRAEPSKLPLIVVSHGTGGSAAGMAWLAETLAANGYLVAAVNHHGNTGFEGAARVEGFVVWWDRPRDVSVLIDRLLADPRFGPRIDSSRIGVAGFSIGGYTALATVGARLSEPQWRAFCAANSASPLCVLPPESRSSAADLQKLLDTDPRVKTAITHMGEPLRDPRVKAAFAIAPVMGPMFTPDSLAHIEVPVRMVVGSADNQAVPTVNAEPIAARIPGSVVEVLPGVTHYTFLPECTVIGRNVAKLFCVDPDGVDRSEVHRRVAAEAVAFFDRTLQRSGRR
jgi:predicted dienelactone hydrolase